MKIRPICLLHVRADLVYVRVNDLPQRGWLGLARLGRVSPPLWAGEDQSTSVLKTVRL